MINFETLSSTSELKNGCNKSHFMQPLGMAEKKEKSLTLRGIDSVLYAALKKECERSGKSLNSLVLDTLRDSLLPKQLYQDLDHLIGSWTEEEYEEFSEALGQFSSVENELWQ